MLSEKIEAIMTRDLNDDARLIEAVMAIEVSLAASAENATADQLADLADAVDAFGDRAYGVAASLARAASQRRRKIDICRRPDSMLQSLDEIRDTFARYKRSRVNVAAKLREAEVEIQIVMAPSAGKDASLIDDIGRTAESFAKARAWRTRRS